MLNIPAALFTQYGILLNKKPIPVSVHNNYKKWDVKPADSSDSITSPAPCFSKERATKSGALSGRERDKVYSDLFAEIKVRHYSPKTLRSYSPWVRRFQVFTKSRNLLFLLNALARMPPEPLHLSPYSSLGVLVASGSSLVI
jgi:hypothetical protein